MFKTLKTGLALAVAGTLLSGCGLQKVPAGYVGVKVYLLGGQKGVDNEVVGVGRYWLGWNEDMYLFPTFTQNYVWTKDPTEGSPGDESISFQTREGLVVSADIGISYSINPEKVSIVFQKYRRGIDEITDTYLRNMVRDALVSHSSKLLVDSIYGEGKADLISSVQEDVSSQVKDIGIDVEKIYWIGDARLPDVVTSSINNKIQATQKAQQRANEIAESKAAADKLIEEARGAAQSDYVRKEKAAEGNKLLAESLSPALLQYLALEKWDGVLPRIIGGDTPVPFLDVTEEGK